nr:MAG TPA: putative NTF2-like transpeptidase [Bacteriophage sp.]
MRIPTELIKDHLVKENGEWYICLKRHLRLI